MKTFRTALFWLHLVAGVIAGIAIAIMCVTGAALAFEREIVAWSERDAREVAPPAPGTTARPLGELVAQVRRDRPNARIAGVAISADPRDALTFPLGREGALYLNPYSGEIRTPASTWGRDFMRLMTEWHRYLAQTGESRPLGKAINGAGNLAFCFLAISGLYLWLPRSWSWRSVRAVAVFNFRLTGKARDFNWHNAIGLWCAPVLIVLTLSALPISYRWAGNLIYRMVGEEPPQAGTATPPATPPARDPASASAPAPARDGQLLLTYEDQLATVQKLFPDWELITLPFRSEPAGTASRPIVITVKRPGAWPRTATTSVTLDPVDGRELKREVFSDFSTGRQIRTWTRFLHTGQALGWAGQFVAGLACLGGCVLVYTGFALAWRRLMNRNRQPSPASAA